MATRIPDISEVQGGKHGIFLESRIIRPPWQYFEIAYMPNILRSKLSSGLIIENGGLENNMETINLLRIIIQELLEGFIPPSPASNKARC